MEKPTVPRKESVPPDVAAAAARKRVEKLEDVFFTLGEDDDNFPVIRDALTKARAQAQVRPVSERIQACKAFFGDRTQTGRGCLSNHRLGSGELGRGSCGAGEGRSIAGGFLLEEKNNPSPFTVPLLWTLLPR